MLTLESGLSAHAQSLSPALPAPGDQGVAESYSPPSIASTQPMRVDVLTATSFVDVETHESYRLYGIDACDLSQTATLGKQTWRCGLVAAGWLTSATLGRWVVCTPVRKDGPATIARCATGDVSDLGDEMVKSGFAVTLPNPEDRRVPAYAQHEREARTAYRGLWGSSFQMPWTFRQQLTGTP